MPILGLTEITLLHYRAHGVCSRNLGRLVAPAGLEGRTMPEIVAHSVDNPEFPRVVEVAKLRGAPEFAFDLSATPEECRALARLMGAQAVRKLRFDGRLLPAPRGAWALEARLGATVVQTCVVSLEPVTTRIDTPVVRLFTAEAAPAGEVVVAGLEEDDTEPLGDRIDLGLVAVEALALALPPYPRREGAELIGVAGPSADGAPEEPEPTTFAALAALRAKMGEGS
jgi:uncharacterized metal-binding protein YceD (DUF177 family)